MNQSLLAELDQVMPDAVQTGLLSSLASFFDRLGGANPTVNALGQPDLTTLVPVTGLQDIPCQLSPEHILNPSPGGQRLPDHFTEARQWHLLLNDYYPAVLMRYIVDVDGTKYEITPGTVEPDSQKQMTRLSVRLYSQ